MTPQQPINLGANTDRATLKVALNDDYENNVVRNGLIAKAIRLFVL